jgi:hypothetical protein
MNKIDVSLAIQILDRCRQLHSFSGDLYCCASSRSRITTSLSSPLFRNNTSPLSITKLDLKLSYDTRIWDKFVGDLLLCCPNLCIFLIDVYGNDYEKTLLNVDWWTNIFASNEKLQRISLQLHWSTRDSNRNYAQKIFRNFESSTYFAQLKASITYNEDGDFPELNYNFSIKN